MSKRLVLLFLLLPLVALRGEDTLQPNDWPVRTFFPGAPRITEASVSNLSYFARAMLRKGTEVYGLQRATFKSNETPSSPQKGYEAVKKLYLGQPGTKLEQEGDTAILGRVGMRLVFTYQNGARTVEIRAVYIDTEYYEFLYERYTRDNPSSDSAKFFDQAKFVGIHASESGAEKSPKI